MQPWLNFEKSLVYTNPRGAFRDYVLCLELWGTARLQLVRGPPECGRVPEPESCG